MELPLQHLLIAVIGGFVAGCINTLAGNGSAITLGILTEVIGLSGNTANGTNRLGVLAQGASSTWVFKREGKLQIKPNRLLVGSVFAGALIGVWAATQISNEQFRLVYKVLMVCMLFVVLVKPKRWLNPTGSDPAAASPSPVSPAPLAWWITVPVYLAIGFYGGFIQMGMGILFLAALVLVSGMPIIEGNAVKSFAVFLYTIAVLAVFAVSGRINWEAAAALAGGQLIGGWLTAEFASRYKKADVWAYWILVVMVVIILIKLFVPATLYGKLLP